MLYNDDKNDESINHYRTNVRVLI